MCSGASLNRTEKVMAEGVQVEWPDKERDRAHVSHSELGTGCAAMEEGMYPRPHRGFGLIVSIREIKG